MKIKKRLLAIGATSAFVLCGCGSVNQYLANDTSTTELYHIYDIQTHADVDTVSTAAADGLAQNTNQIQQNRPLVMSKSIPAQPGRFQLIDAATALAGTGMGAFLQMSTSQAGQTPIRMAKCEGAVWTSKATRSIPGYNNLTLYSCLYEYKQGYQLDVYGTFQKTSGGLNGLEQSLAGNLVGTPDQWVNKTIVDTVRSIATATHAQVVQIEGQPKIAGDSLPWVDRLSSH